MENRTDSPVVKHLSDSKSSFFIRSLVFLCLLVCTVQAQSTIEQLFAFACNTATRVCPDGFQPNSLIQSANGSFYGTTALGGLGNHASGTVFKITSSGSVTVIYTFLADQNGNFPNGAGPTSLVEGNDGFLYGTTSAGGANNFGVVFKLSKAGAIKVLHSFCSLANCADGDEPANLLLGNDGNFYGSTAYSSPGTLFRITPSGSYTLLHTFNFSVEGPACRGWTQASDGNFYGTTIGGLELHTSLFRLTPGGQFTILHTFVYSDFATSGVVEGTDGKLYGVSRHGGPQSSELGLFVYDPANTAFEELSISGTSFRDFLEYIYPASDLKLWSIYYPGGSGPGELVTTSNEGSLLQTVGFNGSNGAQPDAPVLEASNGNLLGVTFTGGSVPSGETANGVVFSLAGLPSPKPAFVSFAPQHGSVGSTVIVHGVHFIGTTRVTFNGVSATFKVLNTGNLQATVPVGATAGAIAVTNAGGTTLSQNNFSVQ